MIFTYVFALVIIHITVKNGTWASMRLMFPSQKTWKKPSFSSITLIYQIRKSSWPHLHIMTSMGWSLFTYLFLIWFQLFLTLFLKHCMEVWFWGRECIIPHTVLSHYFISKFSIVLFIRVNTQTCCWVYTHALVRGTISIRIFFFFLKSSNKTKTILQTVFLSLDIESKTKLTFDMWLLQNWSYN